MMLMITRNVITAIVNNLLDTVIIIAAALINSVISFLQEFRAEAAIEALAGTLTSETSMLEAAEIQRISAVDLVTGDIDLHAAGGWVPADMRSITSKRLLISEAALTGVTVPTEKHYNLLLSEDTLLPDHRNKAYAYTPVNSGAL
jgi:cation-transporting P-type ATPase F